MRFEDETYSKLFRRETPTMLALSWQARALWHELIKKFDAAGMIECGPMREGAISLVARIPLEVVRPALKELIEHECVVWTGAHDRTLLAPNYTKAQESVKARGVIRQDHREKAKALARAASIQTHSERGSANHSESLNGDGTKWDQMGPHGTKRDPPSSTSTSTSSSTSEKTTALSAGAADLGSKEVEKQEVGREVVQRESAEDPGPPPPPDSDGTPDSEPPQPGVCPEKLLQAIWNQLSVGTMPKVSKITDSRRKSARARWREKPDEGYWRGVIQRICDSKFCRGEQGGTWVANFDWLLRPDTHVRVSEGRYDGRGKSQTNGMNPQVIRGEGYDPYAR